jgi:HK97 family phage prohead protease
MKGIQMAVEFSRSFALEDIAIRSGPHADGRTVVAYASVFNVPTNVDDHDGQYSEVIDPRAFAKAINDARPAGNRSTWKVGVFFNHAKTIYGTPSELHSVPIGVCVDMRADTRGLLTTTRYLPGAENVLDAIKEGAITAYSFSGQFMRSDPLRSGKFRRDSRGGLPVVRRLESSLREYGPTPFPYYESAEIVGVRAEEVDSKQHRREELRREYAALEAKRIIAEGPAREREYSKLRALEIIAQGDVFERRVAALRSAAVEDRRSRWAR